MIESFICHLHLQLSAYACPILKTILVISCNYIIIYHDFACALKFLYDRVRKPFFGKKESCIIF